MECSIGIDLGGTKILAALIDVQGNVVKRISVATPTDGSDGILTSITESVQMLQSVARDQNIEVRGLGVGTAGQIDFATGHVLAGTANIPGWNDVAIRDILSSRTGLTVWVDNDVNVFTLAEAHLGSARGTANAICLAFGTGVGGGVLIDGQLLRGAWGSACELGHICLDLNGIRCKCGSRGCLETFASGTWLPIRMRDRLDAVHSDSPVVAPKTSKEVFALYFQGETCAVSVVEEMVQAVSLGIITLIHTFNPNTVVLGGGLVDHNPWIVSKVREQLKSLGLRSLVDPVGIQLSHFGSDAGVIGAALQSWIYG